MKALRRTSLAIAVSSIVALPVHALEPAPIDAGPVKLTPTVKLSTAHDDNIFANNTDKDSMVNVLDVRMDALAQQGVSAFTSSFGIESANFSDSSDDNYTDWNANVGGHWEFGLRSALDVRAKYEADHLDRSDDEARAGNEIDKFDSTSFGAAYALGAKDARGRLVLDLDNLQKRFDDSDNAEKDVDVLTAKATFFYRVMPKTSLLAEYVYTGNDYQSLNNGQNRDSQVDSYYLGATWEATGKTTGELRFGLQDKEYDNSAIDGDDTLSWQASVTWEPLRHSSLTFTTGQAFDETTVSSATNKERSSVGVNWNHAWSSLLSTNLGYSFSQSDDKGGAAADLVERETDVINASLTYSVRRWVDVGLEYNYTDQEGVFAAGGVSASDTYDRNKVMLFVNVSL